MPTLGEVVAAIEDLYDPAGAQSWDAVGLVCGDPDAPVRRVLLAVDPVAATVEESVGLGASLLLTHHPLLLRGVHSVAADTYKGSLLHRLITSGVALYTAHTNADVANPGVSDALAARFDLRDTRPLAPELAPLPDGRGFGRVGELPQPMTVRAFLAAAAEVLPAMASGVRATGNPDRVIRTVAVAAGAGDAHLADAYLTADLRHHPTSEHTESGGPVLVSAEHLATEQPWLNDAAHRLRKRLDDTVETVVSQLVTDAWSLHVPSVKESSSAP